MIGTALAGILVAYSLVAHHREMTRETAYRLNGPTVVQLSDCPIALGAITLSQSNDCNGPMFVQLSEYIFYENLQKSSQ